MQLKAPASWSDPQATEAPLDLRIPPISRRRLLVKMSQFAGAALLFSGGLKLELTQLRPTGSFWSDGTDWVE